MVFFSQRTQSILSGIVSQQSIRHAYLFSGPPGALLPSAAEYFMMSANCVTPKSPACGTCTQCTLIKAKQSVDVATISPEKSIKVDAIRQLQERVKYGPAVAAYFFVVVEQAHLLNTQASNAFLKLLEEPPKNVVFILLTPTPSTLLLTIRSRCQQLSIPKASSEQLTDYYHHRVSLGETFPVSPDDIHFSSALPYILDQPQPIDMSSYLSFEAFQTLSLIDCCELSQKWASHSAYLSTYLCLWIQEIWSTSSQFMTTSLRQIELLIENISQMQYNLNLRLQLDHLFFQLRSNS